ncbi:head-tail connector protein [Pseudoruegeria sp. SK021]|uniref:head-tail connector protein n=1 Tax=Pseudoruegeria sp. SK021 TaxID=1933035 RepID=UPI000A2554C2|nr:head-tail connector protein [Pseudoruegeria sp. SK021]OSP54345.1 hypothetical protein BV911_13320 [Pseudoruegeria sp. SK021]
MMLVEIMQTPLSDLPIVPFRAHLRLGRGFADDAVQDSVLETCLRAAIAAIEGRTGKALYSRGFRWTLPAWRCRDVQALPVAPVSNVSGITIITRQGDASFADPEYYYLEQDALRPLLRAVSYFLPSIPTGGTAEVTFSAGYSVDWSGMPPDLAQAVLLLAAHYYETRQEQPTNDGNMPFGVTSLIERYRTVRILGGAGA